MMMIAMMLHAYDGDDNDDKHCEHYYDGDDNCDVDDDV